MKDLVIIGAGDFGREIADVVERINANSEDNIWNLLGYIDDNEDIQGLILDDYPVIGKIDWIERQSKEIYAICSIGNGIIRKKIIENIHNPNVKYATLIDPNSSFHKGASVGEGSLICDGTVLAINDAIGNHVLINFNCSIGHDDILEDFTTVNPGVNISGKVLVRESAYVGTGAKILQGLEMGKDSIIGAGAVVIHDVPEGCTVVGVPASVIKRRTD